MSMLGWHVPERQHEQRGLKIERSLTTKEKPSQYGSGTVRDAEASGDQREAWVKFMGLSILQPVTKFHCLTQSYTIITRLSETT